MSPVERRPHTPNPEHLRIGLFCAYPMNVPGGVQEHVRHCASYFREQGHEVLIFCPEWGDTQDLDKDTILLGKGKRFGVEGTNAIVCPYPVGLNPYGLHIEQFHEVEVSLPGLEYLLFSKAHLKIITFHTVQAKRWRYLPSMALVPICHRSIDVKTAVSKASLKFAKQFYPGKYTIIPNGVDTSFFSPEGPKIEQFVDDKVNLL